MLCAIKLNKDGTVRKKMKRSKQVARTVRWDLIPEDHRCQVCQRGKYEVNFRVPKNYGKPYVRNTCNFCAAYTCTTRRNVKTVREKKDVRAEIRHRIAKYFENQSKDRC